MYVSSDVVKTHQLGRKTSLIIAATFFFCSMKSTKHEVIVGGRIISKSERKKTIIGRVLRLHA